jgi:hypothetical protein
MRSRAIRARDVTTEDQVVIHGGRTKRDAKYKICEVYKNSKQVRIVYRDDDAVGGHVFVTIDAKPMHRVRVL